MSETIPPRNSLLRDTSFILKATNACDEMDERLRQLARLAISSPRFGPETYLTDNIHVGYALRGLQHSLNVLASCLPSDSDVGLLLLSLSDEILVLRAALADGVAKTVPEMPQMQRLANQVYFGDILDKDDFNSVVEALSALITNQSRVAATDADSGKNHQ